MLRFINKNGEEKLTILDNSEMIFATEEEKKKYEQSLLHPEGEDEEDERP